jgi:hypothetical protein
MTRNRKILFLYGLALLLGFALTGQYLQRVVQPAHEGDAAIRMMARANHLYLLFISLLIMVTAFVENPPGNRGIAWAMNAGRGFLLLSSAVLIAAFFRDHAGSIHDRSMTFYGCVAALTGTVLLSAKAIAVWKRA